MTFRGIMAFVVGFGFLLLTFFVFNQIPFTNRLIQRALRG